MKKDLHTIDCTGDCVAGDEVKFERDMFSGTFRKATFIGTKTVEGRIIKESYGADRQQHTFTIELADGSKTRIKGRNLYANGVTRKPWACEDDRREAVEEKHRRGREAREARLERLCARDAGKDAEGLAWEFAVGGNTRRALGR